MKEGWMEFMEQKFIKDYINQLAEIVTAGRRNNIIYPEPSKVFRIFSYLSPSEINVVILGQDPYHDGSADGFAFSNSTKSGNISPSLRNIFQEIDLEFNYPDFVMHNPDLERWVKQGIFLANTILTVEKGKPLSHQGIGWEEFTQAWLKYLSTNYKGIVFILWGNYAKSYRQYINEDKNLVLTSKHPSPMSANQGGWFGNNHFRSTNEYLTRMKGIKIEWI